MADAIVIVGAGEAGTRAALSLREQGFSGEVVLIGEEPHPPYERPPLSKAILTHPGEPEAALIATAARLAEAGIAFRHDTCVVRIDRARSCVVLGDGTAVAYARLLLATGARPRVLAAPGSERALYLRTFADALGLRARLPRGAHLVVVGGGFIGLEVAASAGARGCRVTLLEAGSRILMRGVPQEIAERVALRHAAAGVDLRTGVGIARIEDGPTVVLEDETRIACDGIVAGVGAVPETALAAGCGLAIENGVRVDAMLRTDDPEIYAAGDCCSFPSALYGGRRVRLEAWRNAQEQGALAASNMLGEARAHDAVPWFWSDQYDEVLQVAGLPDAGVTSVRRETGGALLFFHLDVDGRMVAASGVGPMAIAKDIRVAEMLIARRARPDPALLASAGVRLRTLLAD